MKQFYCLIVFCLSFYAYAKEQYKHFVIDICSYNNKKWVARNLRSALNQEYPKEFFHIYYTDDCSGDGTAEYVERYIKQYGLESRITLIKNTERRRALANHYSIIQRCDDKSIIIHLDGDDEFANTNVLSYLNTVYQDPEIWLTYGAMSYRPAWRAAQIPPCIPITQDMLDNKTYRKVLKGPYHPRTFYAWLAKLVKLEDLLCSEDVYDLQHQFFPSCADWALMFPMLEMAGTHVKYIEDQILAIYNLETPFNVYKCDGKKQDAAGLIIRASKSYEVLTAPFINDPGLATPALLLFCSPETCENLERFFATWSLYAHGCPEMYIFVPDTLVFDARFIKKSMHIIYTTPKTFHDTLYETIRWLRHTYILCSTPNFFLNEPIAFDMAARILQKTYAYGFYFKPKLTLFTQSALLENNIYARHLLAHESHIYTYNNFMMTMYNKQQMLICLKNAQCSSFEDLEKAWQQQPVPVHQVGLFFKPTPEWDNYYEKNNLINYSIFK